ncbi:MAG: YetF domain-containing protein [Bacteroidota bacterium]
MNFLKLNWKDFLLGSEDWSFLVEVAFRTFFMFAVILIGLSILGKRGVKQLSVFELVVIIGLGSAAGDPMFYKDVGLLPALIVFTIVISLYIFVTKLVGRNKKVEHLVEGKPVCLIEDGQFAINNFAKEPLGQEEFFAELRNYGISHLGQVEQAIIETNGSISVFYYEDKDVKYGLPVLPGALDKQVTVIKEPDHYACVFCGYPAQLKPVNRHHCPKCEKDKWVKATNKKRVR